MSDADTPFRPLGFRRLPPERMRERAEEFHDGLQRRRSVRAFSRDPVPRRLVELAIRAGSSAPSGAHRQPWTWVAVSDPALKARLREAVEAEERRSYEERMPEEWLDALAPIGTGWRKPHVTDAPWIVVLFRRTHGVGPDGERVTHYYTTESCGIAAGLFIAAVHRAGLATLTHTPSPMGFLSEILGRPENEKPFLLFPVGYPAEDAEVPDLERRPLEEVSVWFQGEDG